MRLVVTVDFRDGRAANVRAEAVRTKMPEDPSDERECAALADVLRQRIRRFQGRGRPQEKKSEKSLADHFTTERKFSILQTVRAAQGRTTSEQSKGETT